MCHGQRTLFFQRLDTEFAPNKMMIWLVYNQGAPCVCVVPLSLTLPQNFDFIFEFSQWESGLSGIVYQVQRLPFIQPAIDTPFDGDQCLMRAFFPDFSVVHHQ